MSSRSYVKPDEFSLWRTVFAFSLIDGILSLEEQEILNYHLKDISFTHEQLSVLRHDAAMPQDIEKLYSEIGTDALKRKFCQIARTLVWSGGDIDLQEKEILKRLSCIRSEHLYVSPEARWFKEYTKVYENISRNRTHSNSRIFESRI